MGSFAAIVLMSSCTVDNVDDTNKENLITPTKIPVQETGGVMAIGEDKNPPKP